MQYASIVVNSKTKKINQKFTYLIKPEQLPFIKSGLLVEIPFGRKKIFGVIWDIKKHEKSDIKFKLKSISKIIDKKPVLNQHQKKIAEMISNYYLASLGEVVFFMIPPPAKRILSNMKNSDFVLNQKNNYISNDKKPFKNKIYTIYDRLENRIEQYLKLINKVVRKNNCVLILIPEILGNDPLINKIKSEFDKVIVYDTNKTKTQRYQDWLDIRSGKYQIVIGTRSAIFLPITKLGLMIIDSPHHFAFKEERSPHYHCLKIVKWLSCLLKINLILGDSCPSVSDKFNINEKKYINLKSLASSTTNSNININLIDSSKEKTIISWFLENEIRNNLKNKQKIILYVNRKGMSSNILCKNCKYEFKCLNCDLPLVKKNVSQFICYRCNQESSIPSTCPVCKGTSFISFGIGIDKVISEIKKLFPETQITKIEKNSQNVYDADIIVTTKKIFSYSSINADLIGIINIDNILNLPDYQSTENIYFTLTRLIQKCKKQLIVQTKNPDKEIYQYLINNNFNGFLKNELLLRKKYNYPPYSQLIKIIYQDKDNEICKKTIFNIYNKILNMKFEISNLEIIRPVPCFIEKSRGKYRYQIIIKQQVTSNKQQEQLKQIIESLPQGVSVDVDPISLL